MFSVKRNYLYDPGAVMPRDMERPFGNALCKPVPQPASASDLYGKQTIRTAPCRDRKLFSRPAGRSNRGC